MYLDTLKPCLGDAGGWAKGGSTSALRRGAKGPISGKTRSKWQQNFSKTTDPQVTGGCNPIKTPAVKPEFNVLPANLEDGPIYRQQPGFAWGESGSSPVGTGPNWLLELHEVHDTSFTGTTDGLQ
jgi:hypothetical protein